MRYTYHTGVETTFKKFKTKFTSLSTAFVLSVASVSGVAPLFLTQNAFAVGNGDVQIIAAMPKPAAGGTEYVKVKNTSASPVNLNGWIINDGASHTISTASSLAAGAEAAICPASSLTSPPCTSGYSITGLGLNDSGDTITLYEGASTINQVSYTAGQVSEGVEVPFTLSSAPTTASLNAENFNTVDANYKGISVGFNAKDFGTVTAVTVDMTRADGSHVIKHGNQGVFDIISNKNTTQQLTAPFIVQQGSFTEASDTLYWDPAPATWTTATTPTGVTITVTDENGSHQVTNSIFNAGTPSWPTYESLLPPASSISGGYFAVDNTGFNVGFHAHNFTGVSSVTVDLQKSDGTSIVKNTGTQDLFNLINGQADKELSSPFTIPTSATNDGYWNYGNHTGWTAADEPAKAVVTIVDNSGTASIVISPYTVNESTPGATFSALLPDPTNTHDLNLGGTVYRDNSSGCGNYGVGCADKEENLSGWTLRLYRENTSGSWTQTSETATNQDGKYSFGMIPNAGVYHVCEVYPDSGWKQNKQDWSGTPYHVATNNLSGVAGEGTYCTTTSYTDTKDTSSVTYFGNVDVGSPTGTATYTGGNKVGDVIYLKSINDLKYSASLEDNYQLDQTSFVVFKLNNAGHHISDMFCGNWKNSSTTEYITGANANVNNIPISKCSWYKGLGSWTDGTYEIAHRVYDKAGNYGSFNTQTQKFVLDTTAPSTPVITTPTSNQYFKTTPILNSWSASTDTASGVKEYQVKYVYDDHHKVNGSDTIIRTVTGTSRNHIPAPSEQGGVTIWVRAIDNVGNASDWSSPIHYTYDATKPAAPTLVSPDDKAVVNGTSITQAWTDTSSDVDHYIYESYNDATATSLRWHEVFTTTSKTAKNVGQTTYWWRVMAIDKAGNESDWSDLYKITVDNTAPDVQITGYGQDNNVIQPTVTATDANMPLSYVWSTNPHVDISDLNALNPTFTVNQDGAYSFTLTVTDPAGNSTTKTFSFTYTTPTPSLVPQTTQSFTVVTVSQGTGGGTPTPTPLTDNGTGTTAPQVLGTNTEDTGAVAGDNTTQLKPANKDDTVNKSGAFLGLGWWWLLVLAILAFLVAVFCKIGTLDKKS